MTARRKLGVGAVAVVLAVPLLAGCDAAQQAQDIGQGVDKAADCAALVGEQLGDPLAIAPALARPIQRVAAEAVDVFHVVD